MLRPRKTIDADGTRAKLDGLQGAVRRESGSAEADPYDDAMLAAVNGLADILKAEAGSLAEMEEEAGQAVQDVKRRARREG